MGKRAWDWTYARYNDTQWLLPKEKTMLSFLSRQKLSFLSRVYFFSSDTTCCPSWWAPIRQITPAARRIVPTSTWTSSSRRRSSPSTCIDWTATTICTTRTFAGRAPANSSTRTSGVECAPCCTTIVCPSIIRTWTSGGEARVFARLIRGASTSSRVRRVSETPEEESEDTIKRLFRRLRGVPCVCPPDTLLNILQTIPILPK